MNRPSPFSFALPLFLALAACDDPKPTTATNTSTSATTSTPLASVVASAAPSASASAAAAPVTFAAPASYEIDVSHSTIGFAVKHMMISNVRGSFGKFTGALYLDEKEPAKSTLQVDVDTASIDTSSADRDKHLRSPEFLDTAKFPKMTFKSTKVERVGAGYRVTGDLTIRDVTKPVTLEVDALSSEVKDPFVGMLHRGAHATAKLSRKDFGITWSKTIETGAAVVDDTVTLELDVDFARKPAS
jgi:polyisoprenoid-binding protein YceI